MLVFPDDDIDGGMLDLPIYLWHWPRASGAFAFLAYPTCLFVIFFGEATARIRLLFQFRKKSSVFKKTSYFSTVNDLRLDQS